MCVIGTTADPKKHTRSFYLVKVGTSTLVFWFVPDEDVCFDVDGRSLFWIEHPDHLCLINFGYSHVEWSRSAILLANLGVGMWGW